MKKVLFQNGYSLGNQGLNLRSAVCSVQGREIKKNEDSKSFSGIVS